MSDEENVPEEDVSQEDVIEKEHEIEVPEKWKAMPLSELVDKGWKYRLMTKPSGLRYMCIRKANSERSLGPYAPELEKLLFDMFPKLNSPNSPSFVPIPDVPIPKDYREKPRGRKPFLSIPIKRVAVVPLDYAPTLEVIRYFQLFKENGFPGDFSDFLNGNMKDHFTSCNQVNLPVYLGEIENE